MSSRAILAIFLMCSILIFENGVQGGRWNISAQEDLVFEKRLKMLNKPAIKSILMNNGDIYDCVNFYKQPAFDHPLLKDYKVDFDPFKDSELKNGECPMGTVLIKRISKKDLVNEKFVANRKPLDSDDKPGAQYAITKTQSGGYDGAGGATSVWEPAASDGQYSASRIKITNGPDSLEVGWRVDPMIYHDSSTRLYTRIDAGQTHGFDTLFSGFVVVDSSIYPGIKILPSQRGGPIRALPAFLNRDVGNGNWWVEIGDKRKRMGYWPRQLFTGLSNSAEFAEWGGEVFSPPGSPKPAMGAGFIPSRPNTKYDAYFGRLTVIAGGKTIDAGKLSIFSDTSSSYVAKDEGNTGDATFGHLMFFGGSTSLEYDVSINQNARGQYLEL